MFYRLEVDVNDIAMKIYFVGNGGCYHTMDVYRSMEKVLPHTSLSLVTDITSAPNQCGLISKNDKILRLLPIDKLLYFQN